jgi:hypothetical protein
MPAAGASPPILLEEPLVLPLFGSLFYQPFTESLNRLLISVI